MKREIMESAGLTSYAEIGLIIFVTVFIIIIVRVFFMKKKEATEIADIPLEDDISPSETSHPTDGDHDNPGRDKEA